MKNECAHLSLLLLAATTAACSGATSSPPPRVAPPASSAAAAIAVSGVDPENATFTNVCQGTGTMTSKGGKGDLAPIEGSTIPGGFEVEVVGRHDLDGDGRIEILARVSCNFGGAGNLDALWALHEDGDHLVAVDKIPGGDRAEGGLANVVVQGQLVVVERNAGGEAACCADKTTSETWGFSKDHFERRSAGAPIAPTASGTEALATALLSSRDVIGWSAAKHQVAVATTVEEEGTGTAEWRVHFVDVGTRKPVSSFTACGEKRACSSELITANRPALAALLDGFVAVNDGVTFDGDAEKALPAGDLVLRASGAKIEVRKDKGRPKTLVTLARTKSHAAELVRAWHLPGERAVLLRVRMNPGDRYGELNVYEEAHVYAVPDLGVPASR